MTKAVSNENLALFKQKCDQTYAKVGESNKGGYQDQEYIDSRFDVGSLTYTDNTSGISIPVNYYYQKGSVDPNTVAINGTIDFSVSGSAMLSVPFTTYAEFYCALQLCFEYGAISGTSYDLEVQCNDIETLRSNIQTYWAFPYDFSVYKYPNAPYVYSDYGVKDFDIKIEESGQYISSGFHRDSYHYYYEVNTTGFIKNVDSKYKINFTSYSNVLPAPAPGYAGQVPVVNAAGNGYDLQAQSSGGITQSTVIERLEELPTATADSPDFVEVGGTLYRKKAVDSGSLIGTWVFNDTISSLAGSWSSVEFNVSFTSNNVQFIRMNHAGPDNALQYYNGSQYTFAYDFLNNTWCDSAYKTIQITDTSALTNEAEFTSWLTANATQTSGGASVSYEYVAQQDAGAGGGGGSTKKYAHNIYFINANDGGYTYKNLITTIILEKKEALTDSEIYKILGMSGSQSQTYLTVLFSGAYNNDYPSVKNAICRTSMDSNGHSVTYYYDTYADTESTVAGGSDAQDFFFDEVVDLSTLGIS